MAKSVLGGIYRNVITKNSESVHQGVSGTADRMQCYYIQCHKIIILMLSVFNYFSVLNFEGELLSFSSPANTIVLCVNLTIYDDDTLSPNKMVFLGLATDNSYVMVENDTSVITIVENDSMCFLPVT